MVAQAGNLDISLNLVPRGDVQGIPLVDMSVEDYVRPITTGITTNFITARAAARHMITQGSGVILALDSGSAHGSPMMGATGSIDAALDTYIRNLAVEIGPHGVRALGIWVAGIPETFTPEKLSAVNNQLPASPEMMENILNARHLHQRHEHVPELTPDTTKPPWREVTGASSFVVGLALATYAVRQADRVVRRPFSSARRSLSRSSSSGMERRSRSMSQCVLGGLTFFCSGCPPSTISDSLPCNLHSHTEGISASSENGTSNSWFLGQA